MRDLYSQSRKYRKIVLRNSFLQICQILGGKYFGTSSANTGKFPANYSCIGFVPGGKFCDVFVQDGRTQEALKGDISKGVI